jgi:hypothetical protein
MRKIICGLLVLALLTLVACKKEGDTNNYYRTGPRVKKEKIEARAATWAPNVATEQTLVGPFAATWDTTL